MVKWKQKRITIGTVTWVLIGLTFAAFLLFNYLNPFFTPALGAPAGCFDTVNPAYALLLRVNFPLVTILIIISIVMIILYANRKELGLSRIYRIGLIVLAFVFVCLLGFVFFNVFFGSLEGFKYENQTQVGSTSYCLTSKSFLDVNWYIFECKDGNCQPVYNARARLESGPTTTATLSYDEANRQLLIQRNGKTLQTYQLKT